MLTNTIVDPGTMMIIHLCALIADITVQRTIRFISITIKTNIYNLIKIFLVFLCQLRRSMTRKQQTYIKEQNNTNHRQLYISDELETLLIDEKQVIQGQQTQEEKDEDKGLFYGLFLRLIFHFFVAGNLYSLHTSIFIVKHFLYPFKFTVSSYIDRQFIFSIGNLPVSSFQQQFLYYLGVSIRNCKVKGCLLLIILLVKLNLFLSQQITNHIAATQMRCLMKWCISLLIQTIDIQLISIVNKGFQVISLSCQMQGIDLRRSQCVYISSIIFQQVYDEEVALVGSIMYRIKTLLVGSVKPLLDDLIPLCFLYSFTCILDVQFKDRVVVVECTMMDWCMILFIHNLQQIYIFF